MNCLLAPALSVLLACGISLTARHAVAQGKDYLTGLEADKIRDAETPNERIKLFLEFAADRLKKFNYEHARASQDRRHSARLAALLAAYAGCLDDATELVQIGRVKQQDIRPAVELVEKKGREFLVELQRVADAAPDSAPYREDLDDALLATKDALAEAEKAKEEIAPPPVRRKP